MTGHARVVLSAYAFIKGWLIAATLWVGVALLIAVLLSLAPVFGGAQAGQLWGLGLAVIFWGYGIALVVAAPLGWVLAYLLRPVRKQWIHILAFFVVPTVVFWVVAGLLGIGWHPGLLSIWATVGAAAGVGRWAVRKDVTMPGPSEGAHEAA